MLSEIKSDRQRQILCYHLYVDSKKNKISQYNTKKKHKQRTH